MLIFYYYFLTMLIKSTLFQRSKICLNAFSINTLTSQRLPKFASSIHNKAISAILRRSYSKIFKSILTSSLLSMSTSSTTTTSGKENNNVISSTTLLPKTIQPIEYFRLDYKKSDFTITDVYLSFQLDESKTIVTSTCQIIKQSMDTNASLELHGEDLELQQVKLNNIILSPDQYIATSDKLVIPSEVLKKLLIGNIDKFQFETIVLIKPDENLSLSGLYKSGSSKLLCTQCEAMGFRRITYHLDRPDILSRYKVRLEANHNKFPLLLSNGNLIESGKVLDSNNNAAATEGSERHYAVWEDPFPKPSYLFALVAGDLGSIHSTYTTISGRVVQLGIFSDKENADQLEHAMYSIKESMKWDEDTFGLECDLDIYNIVATNDFNMGAMENKGLNIFNSAYVLADPKTATDDDYERILGVIGHEYFHNWSGNRVTVRDWFQLTLKEGLTVFRDQWFSSDLTSHAVKRIEDVRGLRGRQFAEDGGPMAHPIRPESYISMDNFYTSTVYSKGAEIVGIYKTILGEEGFKKGMKLYFQRFDGLAVTCDDFRNAMADANNVDLSQMDRWYSQAGTPVVTATHNYNAITHKLELTLSQITPTTPGQTQAEKLPLLIPIVIGLLDSITGEEILSSTVLQLYQAMQVFTFDDIKNKPVISLLRDFSAPVKLEMDQTTDEELIFLMAFDTDCFNRWDAGNRYFTKLILDLATTMPIENIAQYQLPTAFVDAVKLILKNAKTSKLDLSLVSYALQVPDLTTLLTLQKDTNLDGLYHARKHIKKTLATLLYAEFEDIYTYTASSSVYQFNPLEVGRRRLHNTCLDYLTLLATDPSAIPRVKHQYDEAICMTEKLSSLAYLASIPCVERDIAIESFYKDAAGNALVINKWFMIQALADYDGIIDKVKELKSHPAFILSNPNRARSLISAFASNLYHFHSKSGEGYKFLVDCIIELDKLNPQVAARMVSSFAQWRSFDIIRKSLMESELKRIQAIANLSPDTYEVVLRCLK